MGSVKMQTLAWKRGKQELGETELSKQHWKVGRMEMLLGRTLSIQCFCDSKGNI